MKIPSAGSRSGTYVRLVAIAAALLFAGLLIPIVAGDEVASEVVTGSDDEFDLDQPEFDDEGMVIDTATTVAAGEVGTTDTPGVVGAPSAPTSGGQTPSAGSSSPRAPAAAGPLTATDVGVTASVIKVGMLILDVGPIGAAGTAINIDPEQQQAAWQSFVDEVNEAGGINGRKIEPYYAVYDVLSDDSAKAACVKLTEDAKVFIVLGGFSKPQSARCVLEEHATPMVDYIGYHPDSLYAKSGNRLFTTFPSATRMMRNLVHELDRINLIGKRKVGIVTDDQNDPGFETAALLESILKAAGHTVARISKLAGSASSQIAVEVQQQKAQGAEVVVLMSGTLNSQAFTQGADQQQWKPQWAASDWGTMQGDTTMKQAGNSFDGAIGVTVTRNYEFRGNVPEGPVAKECREIYERRSGRKLAQRGEAEYSLTTNFCDTFRTFRDAAIAAGAQLTRPSFSKFAQDLGPRQFGAVGDGSFRPGKFDGSDHVRLQRWRLDCRCWTYVDAFRPSRF